MGGSLAGSGSPVAARGGTGLCTPAAVVGLAAAMLATGCQAPPRGAAAGLTDVGRSAPSRLGEHGWAVGGTETTEAVQLLRDALDRTRQLEGYQVIFHRRERRGLFDALSDWEKLLVLFRKQPRAVKMTWLDPASEYAQVVYVAGRDDGKVTVLPRRGPFGLPAAPLKVEPEAAVQWGKALRPITDFGLANTLGETLARVEQAQAYGGATVRDEGITEVAKLSRTARHIVILYPDGFVRTARQDLYIDAQTGYPAGTYLWLRNGELLAAYLYEPPQPMLPEMDVFTITDDRAADAR